MNKSLIVKMVLFLLVALTMTACTQVSGDGVILGNNYMLKAGETHKGDLAVLGGNVSLQSGSTVDGDLFVLGGNITIEDDSTINGDMAALGGNVTMEGRATGDVGAVGGNVDVGGTIKGDLAVIGGNANLLETAVVDGDINLFGGQLNRAQGARVDGNIEQKNEFQESLATPPDDDDDDDEVILGGPPISPGKWRSVEGPGFLGRIVGDIFWNVALLIVLGLITWLTAAFMPEQMMNVRQTILEATPISFGLGLLTSVASVVVIPLALLLLVTICLALVPIAAYALLGVATLFGWIVIGQIIGERLLVASGRSQPGFIFSSVVGVTVLTVIANMPVVGEIPCIGFLLGLLGWLAFILAASTGLGAVLLTRFGARLYPGPGYSFSGRGGPRGSSSIGLGPRVRWADPAPNVSDEERAASEVELNARIKAALAEADRIAGAERGARKGEPDIEGSEGETPEQPERPVQAGPEVDEASRRKPGDEPGEGKEPEL